MTYIVFGDKLKYVELGIHAKYKEIKGDTEKGIAFSFDGKDKVWLPKSMVAIDANQKIVFIPSKIAADRQLLVYGTQPEVELTNELLEKAKKEFHKLEHLEEKKLEIKLLAHKLALKRMTRVAREEKEKPNAVEDYRYLNPKRRK